MVYTLGQLTACIKELCSKADPVLDITTEPLYEYRDVWAEESGGADAVSAEWSFGNGATGFIGLPFDAGWELIAISYHADTYPATASISVAVADYQIAPSNAATNVLATISLASATDGGGTTNNACKYVDLSGAPVTINDKAIIGFRTTEEVGSVSDHRVHARFRRQIGNYVSGVTFA